MVLPPLPELDRLVATRASWHALAEHILAAARHRATGRIGLVVVPGGFATPPFAADDGSSVEEEIRVVGRELVVRHGAEMRSAPVRTLGDAAFLVGIEPGAPVASFTPTTTLAPARELVIDDASATALGIWFELGWRVLAELREQADPTEMASAVQLWPEHFDAAVELGDADCGRRGTFGISPGDEAHPTPYLYVTHWSATPEDPYWNATAFPGALRSYESLRTAPDPVAAAHEFYAEGRVRLGAG